MKISFLDVMRYVALQQELAEANRRVQTANQELKASNEELQSTKLEMQSLTEEARRHTQQMDQLHHFLSSILSSMRKAVVVVDRDLRITTWNQAARDLWGLSADEVQGEHLMSLDIGLDLSPLRRPIMECLDGRDVDPELEVDATSRRGTPVHLRITFSPLKTGPDEISGVVLTMDMVRPRQ